MKFFQLLAVTTLFCLADALSLSSAAGNGIHYRAGPDMAHAAPMATAQPVGAGGNVAPAHGAVNAHVAQPRPFQDQVLDKLSNWLANRFGDQVFIGLGVFGFGVVVLYHLVSVLFSLLFMFLYATISSVFDLDFTVWAMFYNMFMTVFITGLYHFRQGCHGRRQTLKNMWDQDKYVQLLTTCTRMFAAAISMCDSRKL